jgi:hypothetical protein
MPKTKKSKTVIFFNEEGYTKAKEQLINLVNLKRSFQDDYKITLPTADPIGDAANQLREEHPAMKEVPNDEALLTLYNINPARITARFNEIMQAQKLTSKEVAECLSSDDTINEAKLREAFTHYPVTKEEEELFKLSSSFMKQVAEHIDAFKDSGFPYLYTHLLQDVSRGSREVNFNTWSLWVRRSLTGKH